MRKREAKKNGDERTKKLEKQRKLKKKKESNTNTAEESESDSDESSSEDSDVTLMEMEQMIRYVIYSLKICVNMDLVEKLQRMV